MGAENVTASKPKVGGAIYRATGTYTVPTNATSALVGYTALGYISEDGLTNDNSPETSKIKAFGGDTVLTTLTAKDDSFGFTLLEVLDSEVLKAVYNEGNVEEITVGSGDEQHTEIKVTAKAEDPEEASWVVELVMKNGALKRIVIPTASITEIGTITYKDDEAVGYETTITAVPDSNGNTHYEYIYAAE